MIYDRFKEEYIDDKDIDPIAPPERYIVDYKCLAHNAAESLRRAIIEAIDNSNPEKD
jgi:hypothetical protein